MAGAGAPCAQAALTYDLRVAGGGKAASVTQNGQIVDLELFAIVTGAAGNAALEGFQEGYVTVTSSNGGNIRGDLTGTLASAFITVPSEHGLSHDLDGDGDKDLGSLSTAPNTDFIFARAGSMVTAGVAVANGQEFKLANIKFTVTGVTNFSLATPIFLNTVVMDFARAVDIEAVWQQDGEGSSMTPTPGGNFPNAFPSPGTSVQIIAIPEPGFAALLLLGAAALAFRRSRFRHKRTALP